MRAPNPHRSRRSNLGWTLVELLVVVSIIGILAALTATNLSELKGRYRMNAAARQLVDEVEMCRVNAISENKEFALVLLAADPAPLNGEDRNNVGSWEIQFGQSMNSSTAWTQMPRGQTDLKLGPHAHKGVSLEPWTPLQGPTNYNKPDSIVFSPRGHILNNPSDFDDGVIRLVLRNKAARYPEARVVRIDRGGGAQIAALD